MIVWGGFFFDGVVNHFLNTGGRYDPTTDSWTATSTVNAPSGREYHSAVWTGSEMIVWGGIGQNFDIFNTGGRYNSSTDSWTATSTTNAPSPRYIHTAVWTGSEMIIWGGVFDLTLNTGGRYNPSADSWTTTSTANVPVARESHTAIWTGSEMIVWGGVNYDGVDFVWLNSGGRYNPSTGSWIATTANNAPSARSDHAAVWTGSEMIVWGGFFSDGNNSDELNTGGRYNPSTDSWTATSTDHAPSGRGAPKGVWTGDEMIVWGGEFHDPNANDLNTGGRYDPSTDSWIATSTVNVPTGRIYHTAVWTGSQMIVWGGTRYNGSQYVDLNTGGKYCAQANAPMAESAFSRKVHGAAGAFDIPLPLTGDVGIECRSGGATNDYQMIVNFANSVTAESASVTFGTGNVSSFGVSGSQITIGLTGVTSVQTITVTLFNVDDGTHVGNVAVSMSVLVGDVNGSRLVNASDVALTKSRISQPINATNFRSDANASGDINATDASIVKSHIGNGLP